MGKLRMCGQKLQWLNHVPCGGIITFQEPPGLLEGDDSI